MRFDKRIAMKASKEFDRVTERGLSSDDAKSLSNGVGATILLTGGVALIGAPPALAGAIGGVAGVKAYEYLNSRTRRKRRRERRAQRAAQRRLEQLIMAQDGFPDVDVVLFPEKPQGA